MAIVDFDHLPADGVAGVHGAGMIGTNSPFLSAVNAPPPLPVWEPWLEHPDRW